MRKILLVLMLVGQSSFAARKELKVAIYNNPPHVFANPDGNSSATGAIVEFVNTYLGSRKDLDVKVLTMPFPRCLAEIENKKVDVAFLVAKTSEREKVMSYSTTSLAKTQSRVIVLKDSKLKEIKQFSDLDGWTLGSSQYAYLPPELLDVGVKFDRLGGLDHRVRNLERVRLKKIDGLFIANGLSVDYLMAQNNKNNEFRVLKVPNEMELYAVFRKDLDPKTVQLLNDIIEKNHANYQTILSKYILKDAP